jgi:hypothetical protein
VPCLLNGMTEVAVAAAYQQGPVAAVGVPYQTMLPTQSAGLSMRWTLRCWLAAVVVTMTSRSQLCVRLAL